MEFGIEMLFFVRREKKLCPIRGNDVFCMMVASAQINTPAQIFSNRWKWGKSKFLLFNVYEETCKLIASSLFCVCFVCEEIGFTWFERKANDFVCAENRLNDDGFELMLSALFAKVQNSVSLYNNLI